MNYVKLHKPSLRKIYLKWNLIFFKFICMEKVGFMTYNAASHQRAIKFQQTINLLVNYIFKYNEIACTSHFNSSLRNDEPHITKMKLKLVKLFWWVNGKTFCHYLSIISFLRCSSTNELHIVLSVAYRQWQNSRFFFNFIKQVHSHRHKTVVFKKSFKKVGKPIFLQ